MEKRPSSSTNTKRSFYRRKLPYQGRIADQGTNLMPTYLKAENNRKPSPTITSAHFGDMRIKQVETKLTAN
jgi:hypothetical protein